MSTHEVELTVKVRARVHIAHGLVSSKQQKLALKEARTDIAGFISRRVAGVSVGKGDFSWEIRQANEQKSWTERHYG